MFKQTLYHPLITFVAIIKKTGVIALISLSLMALGSVSFASPNNTETPQLAWLPAIYDLLFTANDPGDNPSEVTLRLRGQAGASKVSLTWDAVPDADSYEVFYATESFGDPVADVSNFEGLANSQRVTNIVSDSLELSDLTNFTIYYFVLRARVNGVATEPSSEFLLIPEILQNDTGQLKAGIQLDGFPGAGIAAGCFLGPVLSQQDCSHGRDVTDFDNSDGFRGFSFTKLAANGDVLPSDAMTWSCVQDNVTGLVWEVKSNNGGLHDTSATYRWGGKTTRGLGYGTYYADWNTLVDGSNLQSYCGFNDWRIPTPKELLSLMSEQPNQDNDLSLPLIDTNYFPNTQAGALSDAACYWSNTAYASDFRNEGLEDALCWRVNGLLENESRDNPSYVRLVRGGL